MKISKRQFIWKSIALASLLVSRSYAEPFGTAAPDVEAGRQKAAMCSACHSADGISKLPSVPHLAGQQRSYLERALHAYREGQHRHDLAMTALAKRLSDADIVNIAAFFSSLPRMNTVETTSEPSDQSADVTAGKRRAAVCFACHSPNGISKVTGIPYLAGQHRKYLSDALHGYRDGGSRDDLTMTSMAAPLSDRDIANVTAYFSSLKVISKEAERQNTDSR